jgi:hypothetical protein
MNLNKSGWVNTKSSEKDSDHSSTSSSTPPLIVDSEAPSAPQLTDQLTDKPIDQTKPTTQSNYSQDKSLTNHFTEYDSDTKSEEDDHSMQYSSDTDANHKNEYENDTDSELEKNTARTDDDSIFESSELNEQFETKNKQESDDFEQMQEIELDKEEPKYKFSNRDSPKSKEHASIMLRDIPFYYLDTATQINDYFPEDLLGNKNIANFEIHMAVFQINESSYAPYLTYLLHEQPNNTLSFPHFSHELTHEMEDKESSVQEECKKRLYKMYNLLPSAEQSFDLPQKVLHYHGCIPRDGEILMLFEYRPTFLKENERPVFQLRQPITGETKNKFKEEWNDMSLVWTTLHEIINSKQVFDLKVNPLLSSWFLDYPDLLYLTDAYDTPIEIPYTLYPLNYSSTNSFVEKNEENTTKPEESQTEKPQIENPQTENPKKTEGTYRAELNMKYKSLEPKHSILPPYIAHEFMKDVFYYFSNDYLGNPKKWRDANRYVVFITNTLYLLDQPPKFNTYLETENTFSSVYYQDNGHPIWAIQTIDYFSKME